MVFVEPLNLEYIFVNSLAGSMEIFFFVAIALFAYLAARFRMPNQVFLMMVAVFILFMAKFYSLFYLLLIVLVGLFFYYVLSKIPKT